MKTIRTEIEIDAPARVVWDIFRDFSKYQEWNPFIFTIQGNSEVGEQLTVSIGKKANPFTFKPRVTRFHDMRELAWLGRLWFPRLFDGEHVFAVEELGGERCRFSQTEHFSGLLVSLFAGRLDTEVTANFRKMNEALKNRAEQRARAH